MNIEDGKIAQGNVQIRIQQNDILKNVNEERVMEIWKSQKEKLGDALFDGDVICVDSIEKSSDLTILYCFIAKYRYIVASRIDKDFTPRLTILGASGASRFIENGKKYYILAKRSEKMFLAPGLIEFVPSGVVDTKSIVKIGEVDIYNAIYIEFEEEVVLDRKNINKIEGYYVIADSKVNSCDVCMILDLKCSGEEIVKAMKSSEEYYEPLFIEEKDLSYYVSKNKDKMINTSYYFAKEIIKMNN